MTISTEKELIILDLFEAHEIAMHDIYNLFASKYRDYEDFWRGIAEEEKVHAHWVRAIRSKAENGEVSVTADVVAISTIETSLDYIKNQIKEFASQENPVDRAFNLAMRIENSIIERKIFDVVQTDSEPMKKTLLNLVEKTRMHYARIKEMAKKRTCLHSLVDSGILSVGDLASASDIAAEEGESIESVVMEKFKVSKAAILTSISTFCNLPEWSLDEKNPSFPAGLSQMLAGKYEALKSNLFVPVAAEGRKIVVAMADPMDIMKRDYVLKSFPNREVEFRVGTSDDIAAAVDAFFGIKADVAGKSMDEILQVMKSEAIGEPFEAESVESEIQENDSAVVRLVNSIIGDASNRNASDIHIEPSLEGDVLVRYRIDGMMSRAHIFPRKFRNAVSSRIKIMAGLDIAERRKPQSGKIRFKRWGPKDIELRVETYTTASDAEDVVMRILASSKPLPLEELKFSRRNLDEFIRLVSLPYGIILCVGPTGSGKTTTLQSALKYLNKEDTKILTAEDPVEITQEGLRQIQMNPRAGITFASSMRSFLRADPDVIMIGEMRDFETASTAIEASLTGHLVLSTLHTNSAPETIVRLIEMGIDPYSLADSLLGILAQRLVRTLCPDCKKVVELDDKNINTLRQEYGSPDLFDDMLKTYGKTVYTANEEGCDTCRGKGYKGRIAIHELLTATDKIKEAVYHKATASEIRNIAIEQGMKVLRQDGMEKVLSGKTTIEEIRAATSR
jgi:type II secretory ATPase GspE/PulE/Tfp pilus assembly ATPase PilB-like protein